MANLAAIAERALQESLGPFTLTVVLSWLRYGDHGVAGRLLHRIRARVQLGKLLRVLNPSEAANALKRAINHRRGKQRCGPESEASHFSDGVRPAKQLLKAGNPIGGGEAHPRAINHSEGDVRTALIYTGTPAPISKLIVCPNRNPRQSVIAS